MMSLQIYSISACTYLVDLYSGRSMATARFQECHIYNPPRNQLSACILQTVNNKTKSEFEVMLSRSKMIEIFISFPYYGAEYLHQNSNSMLYQPWHWEVVIGHVGQTLLTLDPNYDMLSLWTLQIGISSLELEIQDFPQGCLSLMDTENVLYVLREFLLNELQGSLPQGHICSMAMMNNSGTADILPACYKKETTTKCYILHHDLWMTFLNVFVMLVKVFTVLYCPLFLPQRLYRLKYVASEHIVHLRQPIELKFMVSKHRKVDNEKQKSFHLEYFLKWTKFKEQLKNLIPEHHYSFFASAFHIRVNSHRLIPKTDVPIGLIRLLFDNFIRCKLRYTGPFWDCCQTRLIGSFGFCDWFKIQHTWFGCCKGFVKFVLLLFIPIPWIIRLLIYYRYEKEQFINRKKSAEARSLEISFSGNLLIHLTPIHWLFLAIYIMYLLDFIFFGVLAKEVGEQCLLVLRTCFQDMREALTDIQLFWWALSILLWPYQRFGVFGLLLTALYWPFALPFVVLVLTVYLIPTVSLTARLMFAIVFYCIPSWSVCERVYHALESFLNQLSSRKNTNLGNEFREREKKRPRKERFLQFCVIILSLLTLFAVIILLTECLGFLVELVAFTIIGIVVNADFLLRFVSLAFIILLYISDSIKSVRLKYLKFHQQIFDIILNRARDDIQKVDLALQEKNIGKAFTIYGRQENLFPVRFLSDKKGLRCHTRSLVLFISAQDKPFIPVRFFHHVCMLSHNGCPGSPYVNYLKTCRQFTIIFVFILFVLNIVMAFSEVYHVSSTNQMFVTLAGGLLPWILKNVLLFKPDECELDPNTISFQKQFGDVIDSCVQNWYLMDIDGRVEHSNTAFEHLVSVTGDKSQSLNSLDLSNLHPAAPLLAETSRQWTDDIYVTLTCEEDQVCHLDLGSTTMLSLNADNPV